MIFEFLKNLFWKSDEVNRKRKSDDLTFSNLSAKRQCLNLMSSSEVCDYSTDNFNSTDMRTDCLNKTAMLKDFNKPEIKVDTKLKILESKMSKSSALPNVNPSSNNQFFLKKDMLRKDGNQMTVYKTHRLTEERQCNEMLLNFITPRTQCSSINSYRTFNTDDLFPIMNSNKYKATLNLKKNDNDSKYSNSSALQSSSNSLTQCQKCLTVSKDKDNETNCSTLLTRKPVEIIKTNSLKDKLSSNKVVKHDFISEISKKYNDRIKQRQKEVQELKKVTCVLSKHNQLLREGFLEEQLSRSMKLCKIFLDEREPAEEPELPELTPEMKERIHVALNIGPSNEILVQSFGLRITRKDIQTLAGLNWLNDEVMNFYMNLLISRGEMDNFPNVYAMNTFFYPKLISGGHAALKRWTRKVDIFSKDILVVPVHLGNHWCMSIVDFRNKSIKYYDSMGSPNNKCLQALKQYIHDESVDKKKTPFDFQDWVFESVKNIPQQMNCSDCGVFSCMFAEYICANKSLSFSQDDMPYFRNKMVYEILSVKLL